VKYAALTIALVFTAVVPSQAFAQSEASRINDLEQRVAGLERRPRSHEAAGGAAFVAATLCALWAQQTGRNAWLWFFLGLFFNVITLLVLLYKNSRDKSGQLVPSG
jgi:hypothetical protein